MRYWDGIQWTGHVATRGVQGLDPLPPARPAPAFRENTVDVAEPAPRRSKGWRLQIILCVVTFGVWLLAIPAVIAWRRGERGLTAGLAVAAVVALGMIGNALPKQEQTVVTAATDVTSSPSAPSSGSPAASSPRAVTPSPTPAPTIAAFADGAAPPSTLPAAPKPTSAPAARTTTTKAAPKAEPTTKPKPATSTTTKKPTTATAVTFANCTKLRAVYPHGVGRPGAVDVTTGAPPVTTFLVSAALYAANSGSDRDKDGVACEQR